MNSHSEIISAFDSYQKPLIITHENADGDAVGSALALFLFLTRMGKKVTVMIDKAIPEAFNFLPGTSKAIFDNFFPRELVIHLDSSDAEVDSLRWSRSEENKKINITITPKSGIFDPRKITFSEGGADFDAVFILDTGAVSRMGKIYEKNRDLFEKLPTINIDHHPDNPEFGKLNLIESNKSSTAEILFNLFKEYKKDDGKIIDADVATCLLAGIITDTGSFQYPLTTPDTLKVAAELINLGGRREEIIKHIYHTRRLSTLHLWGRVLAKMKVDKEAKIAWSTISKEDLSWSKASMEDRKGLVNELMSNVAEADIVLLMTEDDNGVRTSVRTKNDNRRANELASLFGGGGHKVSSGFHLTSVNLEEAEKRIITKAREMQKTPPVKTASVLEKETKPVEPTMKEEEASSQIQDAEKAIKSPFITDTAEKPPLEDTAKKPELQTPMSEPEIRKERPEVIAKPAEPQQPKPEPKPEQKETISFGAFTDQELTNQKKEASPGNKIIDQFEKALADAETPFGSRENSKTDLETESEPKSTEQKSDEIFALDQTKEAKPQADGGEDSNEIELKPKQTFEEIFGIPKEKEDGDTETSPAPKPQEPEQTNSPRSDNSFEELIGITPDKDKPEENNNNTRTETVGNNDFII